MDHSMHLPPNGQGKEDQEQIGRQLREARHTAGLTIRQTAKALNISPATWSAIENGKTRVSSQRLAAASDLFGRTISDGTAVSASSCPNWRVYPPLVLPAPLAGALKAFVEFGYHGATIRIIAERAGLSVP